MVHGFGFALIAPLGVVETGGGGSTHAVPFHTLPALGPIPQQVCEFASSTVNGSMSVVAGGRPQERENIFSPTIASWGTVMGQAPDAEPLVSVGAEIGENHCGTTTSPQNCPAGTLDTA